MFRKYSGPGKTVTVSNHGDLRSFWKRCDFEKRWLIDRIIVEKALTEAQLRRLSEDLRRRVSSPDDVVFLDRLYALEDPRD